MGESVDSRKADAAGRRAELSARNEHALRLARLAVASGHQGLIEAEMRATRGALLRALRARAGRQASAMLDEDFLAVADRPTLYRAILNAAAGPGEAAAADLQLFDRGAAVLRIVADHGFSSDFLAFFAAIDLVQPTACTAAFASGVPVLIDDVARSTLFAGQPTLGPMLATGSRAVHSYPLRAGGGDVLGVLSFHHRRRPPHPGTAALVARCAAEALGFEHRHARTETLRGIDALRD